MHINEFDDHVSVAEGPSFIMVSSVRIINMHTGGGGLPNFLKSAVAGNDLGTSSLNTINSIVQYNLECKYIRMSSCMTFKTPKGKRKDESHISPFGSCEKILTILIRILMFLRVCLLIKVNLSEVAPCRVLDNFD